MKLWPVLLNIVLKVLDCQVCIEFGVVGPLFKRDSTRALLWISFLVIFELVNKKMEFQPINFNPIVPS